MLGEGWGSIQRATGTKSESRGHLESPRGSGGGGGRPLFWLPEAEPKAGLGGVQFVEDLLWGALGRRQRPCPEG